MLQKKSAAERRDDKAFGSFLRMWMLGLALIYLSQFEFGDGLVAAGLGMLIAGPIIMIIKMVTTNV